MGRRKPSCAGRSNSAGFDDRAFYQQISKPIQDRQVPETQLLRDEAFAVAQDYVADPDRMRY